MRFYFIALFCAFSCSLFAQDIIVTNSGESIKAKNINCCSTEYVYYQLAEDEASSILKIKKSDILIVRLADGTKIDPNSSSTFTSEQKATLQEESRFPNIDLTQFHGFLLAKGNCVYVTANHDLDYENAAVERIKHNIKNLGYWTVVDKPEQAHFVFQYGVNLQGIDVAYGIIRTREGYKKHPYWPFIYRHTGSTDKVLEGTVYGGILASEDVNDNLKVADLMFDYPWKYWTKELSKEKMKKNIVKIFYIP